MRTTHPLPHELDASVEHVESEPQAFDENAVLSVLHVSILPRGLQTPTYVDRPRGAGCGGQNGPSSAADRHFVAQRNRFRALSPPFSAKFA